MPKTPSSQATFGAAEVEVLATAKSNFHAEVIGGFRYLGLQEDLKAYAMGLVILPGIIETVKAYATLGEIMDVFRAVFGEYMEPAVF